MESLADRPWARAAAIAGIVALVCYALLLVVPAPLAGAPA